jgi:hypothetical protein
MRVPDATSEEEVGHLARVGLAVEQKRDQLFVHQLLPVRVPVEGREERLVLSLERSGAAIGTSP